MAEHATIRVRPYRLDDRGQVMVLESRPAEGAAVFEHTHFTGQTARDRHRADGIRRDLASGRGLAFLTLEAGATNQPARRLYAAFGYREENPAHQSHPPGPGRGTHRIQEGRWQAANDLIGLGRGMGREARPR